MGHVVVVKFDAFECLKSQVCFNRGSKSVFWKPWQKAGFQAADWNRRVITSRPKDSEILQLYSRQQLKTFNSTKKPSSAQPPTLASCRQSTGEAKSRQKTVIPIPIDAETVSVFSDAKSGRAEAVLRHDREASVSSRNFCKCRRRSQDRYWDDDVTLVVTTQSLTFRRRLSRRHRHRLLGRYYSLGPDQGSSQKTQWS